MCLVVLVVFASWFSLFLVGLQGALPTISFDFHQICSFLVVLMVLDVFGLWFWWFVVRHPCPFPLISIRFGNVFDCFGCFCLMVLVVFGRWCIPYHSFFDVN